MCDHGNLRSWLPQQPGIGVGRTSDIAPMSLVNSKTTQGDATVPRVGRTRLSIHISRGADRKMGESDVREMQTPAPRAQTSPFLGDACPGEQSCLGIGYPSTRSTSLKEMKPGTSSVSVVLVGRFAPDDFSIDALAKFKALAASDLDAARYEALLQGQVCIVRFPWGKLTVTGEKLICEANEAPYIRVADLALKCLSEISPTGMVRLLGINYVAHFEIADDSKRDDIGKRLLPPTNWGTWGEQVLESLKHPATDPRHGGMIAAVMRQGMPDDRPGGYMDVRVEPALRGSVMGVLVSVNDHYAVPPKSLSERTITSQLLDCLESNFDRSIERSMSVAAELMVSA